MSVINSIYNNAPLPLQNAMMSIYGIYWNKRRYGGVFENKLSEYKDRENFTSSQWLEYANKELRRIISVAYNEIPYYRNRFAELGLNAEKIKKVDINTISKLPSLSKDELRKNCRAGLLSKSGNRSGSFFQSSGSTGTPVSILYTKTMHQTWSAAYESRVRNWAGVNRYMPRGMIGGRRIIQSANAAPPYYRYNSFEKQVYFSAYHLSSATAKNYLEGILRHKPEYMVGYAVSNYLLAKYIKDLGLNAPQMKAVLTSSETLTLAMRELFQSVYRCKTFDAWSGVEACGLVSECEHGKLHISPDVGWIELLDKLGNPVKPGETGEVVCTGFLNDAQPLIRYRIGDTMTLAKDQHCSCGREMPIVEDIVGRIEDIITGPDGREMVRFHSVFTGMANIIQAQVVQEKIDTITINIVAQQELTENEKNSLLKRIYSQLGGVNVQIFQVKEIPCDVNGKYRAVISNVNRTYL